MSGLRRKAVAAGVGEAEVDDADDVDDPRAVRSSTLLLVVCVK